MLALITEMFGKRTEFRLLEDLPEMKAGSMPGNHIYLPYKGVSRDHFRILQRDGNWVMEDLGSRNGTFVNAKKVQKAVLKPGDMITAGTITLTVVRSSEDDDTIPVSSAHPQSRRRDTEELTSAAEPAGASFYFPQLVFPEGMIPGQSMVMMEVYRKLHSIAGSDVNVLFIGETGSGKEMLAQTLHLSSPRAAGPFVAVNCAAVPPDLAESELFGIGERVATNVNRRTGKMELAHNGTLLLDELSSFPMPLQAKVLRAVEEKAIYPVGESKAHRADFRLMATSNEEPSDLISAGRLREDLYHRIATVEVRVPSLRQRLDDIEPLLIGMVAQAAARENKRVPGVRRSVLQMLLQYSYPGNVRELSNIVKSMVAAANPGEVLDVELLPNKFHGDRNVNPAASEEGSLHERLDDVTRDLVRQALESKGGNIALAAEQLGITPRGLRKMMQRLGLDDRKK